jgi:D-arabinose 5-phosphate isomerase GutQ
MVHRPAPAASSSSPSVQPFGEAPGKAFDAAQALRLAQMTFDIEAAAVTGLKARTGGAFARAVEQILLLRGRVVVMGMGKSGHIGRKIAATLASTGTPALFVHPAEASHGDLGMITPEDLVLAISNGGESDEMTVILPVLKRLGVALVAMTGGLESTVALHADIVLDSGVESRPVITAGVMPARCNSFNPRPSRMWKRLRLSPPSDRYTPPSVSTPSTSKKATFTPCAANSSSGGKFRAGVIR